ncbi:MAG TPA: FAD-dependent oxidoreductase [Allosphingosinicella sp.]|nr:FAD-dependent oxidoreductase [Allosphingosinicella sp.]
MPDMTRRSALAAGAAATATLAAPAIAQSGGGERTIVVGAGAFGAWTAEHLRRAGHEVLLVDAWGPAHSRASSGGESRMTRGAYGPDEVYARMARDSLVEWRSLSDRAGLPIFHQTGVVFFFPTLEPYAVQTMEVHKRLGFETLLLEPRQLRERFPQMNWDGIAVGLYEPRFGALMARRAIQTLIGEFVPKGGRYERLAVAPPAGGGDRLRHVVTSHGDKLPAEHFVFACGPWLPKLFPDLLGSRIFPTRQEVFFFAPEAGDDRFRPGRLPGWADFNGGDIYYGFPDLEARGFKIAHDEHGPPMDPDSGDRIPSEQALADVRAFMKRRFPALADRPMTEARVCQYENSANGDLLIDRHPQWGNVVLVGAGSGHGFKHGPEVGRYAAGLLTGTLQRAEPRFSLASKTEKQSRAVH